MTVVVSDVKIPIDNQGVNLVTNPNFNQSASGMGTNWGWSTSGVAGIASIVTGNGFSGNAQRVDILGNRSTLRNSFTVTNGKQYRITFKYRASKTLKFSGNTLLVNNFGQIIPANTGAAIEVSYVKTANGNEGGIYFDMSNAQQGVDWFEFDDVSVNLLEADGSPDAFAANIESYNNYYAFGMEMPGRSYNSPKYRYGYNGKEKDREGLGGGGSTYDYGFRIYNPQLAKFLTLDPLTDSYPELTPYQFSSNNPIRFIDLDGLEAADPDKFIDISYYLSVDKIKYEGNSIFLYPIIATNNVVISGWNGTVGSADLVVNPYAAAKKFGKAVVSHVDYVSNTSGSQQWEDFKQSGMEMLKDPGTYEDLTAAIGGGFTAKYFNNAPKLPALKSSNVIKNKNPVSNSLDDVPVYEGPIMNSVSPNVKKTLDMLDEFKSQGGTVKINPLNPSQEINLTFQKGSQKLDFRIETHPVPSKFGGNGLTPQRHMNVDLYPNKKVIPNSGHKILEQQ